MFNMKLFRKQVKKANKTYKEIAQALRINESTLYRKLKRDGDFTREEINILIDFLDIKEPMCIFFYKETYENAS